MFSVINYKVIEMEERRQAILRKLEEKGSVRVAELSKELGCSEVTIRNDIKNMDQEGLLKRTHGGALQIDSKTVRKYSAESIYRNVERKKQIAACAYAFIEDRDTIIIDDASSSFYLAAYIKGHLSATMGEAALQNMEQFHVDKAFIGVHSINFDVGLTSIATPQMQVKRTILKVAEQVYVLADSSKFGGGYVSVICPIQDVYKIITDSDVSRENIKKAQESNISLVIA